EVRKDVSRQL
ncbi:unnamed protein product, partial [Rotaria sp. Silwood1]